MSLQAFMEVWVTISPAQDQAAGTCLNLYKCPWDLLVLAKIQQFIHNHLSTFPRRECGSGSCLGWAVLQGTKARAEHQCRLSQDRSGLDFYENNLYHIDTFAYLYVSFWKEREMGGTASDRSRFLLRSSAFLPTFRNARKPVMSHLFWRHTRLK